MEAYEETISSFIKGADRISFSQLKKDVKDYLRAHEKLTNESANLVDAKAPLIVVDLLGEGRIATVCEDKTCNEAFGNSELPICDKCMIYTLKRVNGWKRDYPDDKKFLFDITDDFVPYDIRKVHC
jgi:hypothetical protein